MILASHNSFSYLPVRKWWMNIFKPIAKCQNKNIYFQYLSGCRYFDFRITFDKDFHVIINHGLVQYDITFFQLNCILRNLNAHYDIHIRVVLDIRNKKKVTTNHISEFRKFCCYLESNYPNIKFCCGELICTKEIVYRFKSDSPPCIEDYSSVNKNKLWQIYPKLYAKFKNNKIKKQYENYKGFLMLDFI